MRERPILFSAPMVRAILHDVVPKTVTRRVMKPQPVESAIWAPDMQCALHEDHWKNPIGTHTCPYGVPGDRLWVRETWADADGMYGEGGNECPGVAAYFADQSAIQFDARKPRPIPAYDLKSWNWDSLKKRPSIFMPRWASRITLEVVSVRVERLQDITEEDAKREGVTLDPIPALINGKPGTVHPFQYREAFRFLWNAINGKRPGRSWSDNPWVFRVEFRRIELGEHTQGGR